MRKHVLSAYLVTLLAALPAGTPAQAGLVQWRRQSMTPHLFIEPNEVGIIVRNLDRFPYAAVRLSVNKEYVYLRKNVPPGGVISLKWSRFLRPDGAAYTFATVPLKYILIETQTTDGTQSSIALDCRKK